MERIGVDGLRIGYERAGDGPPLVLLHGWVGDGPTTWRRQIQALSGSTLVFLPGAGHLCNIKAPEEFNRAVRTFLHASRG